MDLLKVAITDMSGPFALMVCVLTVCFYGYAVFRRVMRATESDEARRHELVMQELRAKAAKQIESRE